MRFNWKSKGLFPTLITKNFSFSEALHFVMAFALPHPGPDLHNHVSGCPPVPSSGQPPAVHRALLQGVTLAVGIAVRLGNRLQFVICVCKTCFYFPKVT